MASVQSVLDVNRELAHRINQEARANPQSPYANKFIGIANGKVVAVVDDFDEMARQLDLAEPDPQKCFWVEASRDYDEVHEIWGLNESRNPLHWQRAYQRPKPRYQRPMAKSTA